MKEWSTTALESTSDLTVKSKQTYIQLSRVARKQHPQAVQKLLPTGTALKTALTVKSTWNSERRFTQPHPIHVSTANAPYTAQHNAQHMRLKPNALPFPYFVGRMGPFNRCFCLNQSNPRIASANIATPRTAPNAIATFFGVWHLLPTLLAFGHMVTAAVEVAFVPFAVVVGDDDGGLSLMTSPVPTCTVLLFLSQQALATLFCPQQKTPYSPQGVITISVAQYSAGNTHNSMC
jgi:hypothetical protein